MGSKYESTAKPVGPAMSSDPRSPNFNYDYMVKDFFGGNFFSQILKHSNADEIVTTFE